MIAADIRRALLRLALGQALRRWQKGLWRWLALMAALWGGLSLAAVTSELPRIAYYGLLMTLLGALPAFLAYPPDGDAAIRLVRRIDSEAALESYLCQEEGPARTLLEPRAALALRLALLDPPRRQAPHTAWLGVFALGLALFTLAQALSLRAGYGISLGYPEKGLLKPPERSAEAEPAAGFRPDFTLVPPEGGQGGQGEASGQYARPSGAQVAGGDYAAPSRAQRRPGNEPAEPESADAKDGEGGAGNKGEEGAGSASGADTGAAGESGQDEEGPRPEGTARQFGYEGSGKALEPSPLLDYRAVFEREYVARTGKESALGPNIAPALAQESIAAYYGSFSRDLILRAPAEARLEELKAAWLRLGSEGAAP